MTHARLNWCAGVGSRSPVVIQVHIHERITCRQNWTDLGSVLQTEKVFAVCKRQSSLPAPQSGYIPKLIPATKTRPCSQVTPPSPAAPSLSKAGYFVAIQFASFNQILPFRLSDTVPSPLSVNLGVGQGTPAFMSPSWPVPLQETTIPRRHNTSSVLSARDRWIGRISGIFVHCAPAVHTRCLCLYRPDKYSHWTCLHAWPLP